MQNEWFMMTVTGYAFTTRTAITVHCHPQDAENAIETLIENDPDATTATLLHSVRDTNGIRRWMPIKAIRRAPDGALVPIRG